MTECNHAWGQATGDCQKCGVNMFGQFAIKPVEPDDLANMEFDVRADIGATDNYLKLFNCYRHNSSNPSEVECDYYEEAETFIHFYVDGDPVFSMVKSGISYIVLASIDKTKEYEAEFQRKKNYTPSLSAELNAGAIDIKEYNEKIAEIEANEKT